MAVQTRNRDTRRSQHFIVQNQSDIMGRHELQYPKDAKNTVKRHHERGISTVSRPQTTGPY